MHFRFFRDMVPSPRETAAPLTSRCAFMPYAAKEPAANFPPL